MAGAGVECGAAPLIVANGASNLRGGGVAGTHGVVPATGSGGWLAVALVQHVGAGGSGSGRGCRSEAKPAEPRHESGLPKLGGGTVCGGG